MERLGLFHGPGYRRAGGPAVYTSLCGAHAFEAGNKRTALAAAAAFVQANGYALDLGGNRQTAVARLAEFSEGRLSQAGVVEWFRLWMAPR